MEGVSLDLHRENILCGNLPARRTFANDETSDGGGVSDQADNGLVRAQWSTAPVHRDERKQAVLDLVPLARPRREVADIDRQAELVNDPLSLLVRLCAAVPAPRFHTVRYAGVLAAASKWRPKIVPRAATSAPSVDADAPPKRKGSRNWGGRSPPHGVDVRRRRRQVAVGAADGAHIRARRREVPQVRGPDETRGARARPQEHRPLPATPRRAARNIRCAPARAPPYSPTAVLRRLTLGDHAA